MIDEIIIATGNRHKVAEIKDILGDVNVKVIAMTDFPNYPRTVEDGKTLEENAAKKAKEAAAFFKKWSIADDTGLEVEYLNGAPGVFSARYAGDGCTYEDNNKKLLSALHGAPKDKRNAQFRCVIAISSPEGEVTFAEGRIFGIISENLAGDKGFGYDPIFFVPEQNKTFAQLDEKVKNTISHRAQALQKAKEIIKKLSEN
ncbi:MAG: XTP/dITP diphosphatase [Endomicrobium sp.]|jgi:XTP/dITP diphosphohydrolase|nr:XTP/dITP diphosphatase [Endomicrobium sp.]